MIIILAYTIGIAIGFTAGYFINIIRIQGVLESVEKKVATLRAKKTKYGAVSVPSAENLRKRGTKEEAAEKAMEESLDEIFSNPL